MSYPIVWIDCISCELSHPVGVNASSGVERETRCPRRLNAAIASLQREVKELYERITDSCGCI